MSNLKKRITNLVTKLGVDENSMLYAKVDTLNKKRLIKFQKAAINRTRFYILCIVVLLKMEVKQMNS